MIRISKSDDRNDANSSNSERTERSADTSERQITITGNPDSVALAKSLINMSLDLHKTKMEDNDRDGSPPERNSGRGGPSGGPGGKLMNKQSNMQESAKKLFYSFYKHQWPR